MSETNSEYLHSPEHCELYVLSRPPAFSHKRYIAIQTRKLLYQKRTNSPYLSSEVFANLTDSKIFTQVDFDRQLSKIRPKVRSLFISSDLIDLLDSVQSRLPNLEVLVSGHSDRNFEQPISIPTTVKHWFSQNNAISGDPRIKILPIGIENLSLGRGGQKKYFQNKPRKQIETRVLVPPFSPTNLIRKRIVFECHKMTDIFDVETQMLYESEYFDLIGRYRFVLCLEGNGFDTHRLWETLYLGSFPIVLKSPWSIKLEKLHLPILVVNSIHDISSELLGEFKIKHSYFNPSTSDVLWSPYWRNIFKQSLS